MTCSLLTDIHTDKQTNRQKSKDRGSPFRAFGVPHFSLSSRSGPIKSLFQYLCRKTLSPERSFPARHCACCTCFACHTSTGFSMSRHPETDMLQLQCNGQDLPRDIEDIMAIRMMRSQIGSQQEEKIASLSIKGKECTFASHL